MSTKSYVVMTDRSLPREYGISELVWLWRTGQLPPNAEYRDADGHWQPLRDLVEPMVESEQLAAEMEPNTKKHPTDSRWWWRIAAVLALTVITSGIVIGPRMRAAYLVRKTAEEKALRYEQEERIADLMGSKVVVPGMTADQVRKSRSKPRKVTTNGSQEEWSYGREIVVFEKGVVIRVEIPRK